MTDDHDGVGSMPRLPSPSPQSTAYHFFFRTKRLPTTSEYWRLVGACTAVGAGWRLSRSC